MIAIIYLILDIALCLAVIHHTGLEATWLQWPYVLASSALWLLISIVGYGPIASAIFWEIDRKERDAEIKRQEAIIDQNIQAVEDMGYSRRDAKRIVELKRRAWLCDGLTHGERAELTELANQHRAPINQPTDAEWFKEPSEPRRAAE